MLTAAVRELHRCYPNQFVTDVRTPCPQLWEHNPHITPLSEDEPGVEIIECHYPLINRSNQAPYHVIHGFIEFLNHQLRLNIKPALFKGDIHLSTDEKSWCSQVQELTGEDIPFWIVAAGGKHDITIKWWETRRYQEVVDYFQGKILFVQVGAADHYHPPLKGIIDLRSKTDLRQLVRLVYHSQGVLCPVTFLMHLAAAVETKFSAPKNRACVVVAGGREPVSWEAYPHHQFLHTNGALLCCDNGGCWKSRTVPLGDGDERDNPSNLCVDVVGNLPRCMDMITAQDVIQRIELYFRGGAVKFLTSAQASNASKALRYGRSVGWKKSKLEQHTFQQASQRFIEAIPECPPHFQGRGIIFCDRNDTTPSAMVTVIQRLRKSGCTLPIQIWRLRKKKWNPQVQKWLNSLAVETVWAQIDLSRSPALRWHQLKPWAMLHSPFQEVLLLDFKHGIAEPKSLFNRLSAGRKGAVFWSQNNFATPRKIWDFCGAPFPNEPELDPTPMAINKIKCWRALSTSLWYSQHADFFTPRDRGEIFHVAFIATGTPYLLVENEDARWRK